MDKTHKCQTTTPIIDQAYIDLPEKLLHISFPDWYIDIISS